MKLRVKWCGGVAICSTYPVEGLPLGGSQRRRLPGGGGRSAEARAAPRLIAPLKHSGHTTIHETELKYYICTIANAPNGMIIKLLFTG